MFGRVRSTEMKFALGKLVFLIEVSLFSFFVKGSFAHCARGRRESTALSFVHDVKTDTALVGHVFKTVSVSSAGECFRHCTEECLCLSYNYRLGEEKENLANGVERQKENCELNDANSDLHPEDLTPTSEVNYYEPTRSYSEEPTGSCSAGSNACSNGCCRSSPCLNGGTCNEVCDPKRRRFNCTGCAKNYGGHRCQIKFHRTCKDLFSGVEHNGIYVVYDEQDKPFKVFCDFTSESGAAWTLILSHTLANNGQFKTPIFMDNPPINENVPEWSAYRLSKSRMLSIRQESTHWRATCNFPMDGVDLRDYLRASLRAFDIMAASTSQCRQYELVNIRGHTCTACTAFTFYENSYTLHLDSQQGASKGCMFDGASGAVNSEDNFGHYGKTNPHFRCSSSPSSTTQYWLGTM